MLVQLFFSEIRSISPSPKCGLALFGPMTKDEVFYNLAGLLADISDAELRAWISETCPDVLKEPK